MKQLRKRLTYSNVMSSIAVFLVLGGGAAFAAGLAKNSVGTKQLKKNAVTKAKIKKNAVTTAKIKNGAVTGAKVNAATLGTVPNATHATSADNANTVGGQSVVKIFKTLNAGQSGIQVASLGGFNFVATCASGDADLEVIGPAGSGFVMESGGDAGNVGGETTEDYESSTPSEGGEIRVDTLAAGGGDANYGISSFYGAVPAGTVVSGTLGYDYDTFNNSPPETCIVAGQLTVG